MHDIHMAEVTENFTRCWNAAGLHIQNQAQGPLQSWLRAHLNPPFLEHLSFRLGNQLFFIQLEDVDGRLETPGNPDGLLAIADGCAGHACVMPMRRVGADWEPTEPGWGLLDAGSRQPVSPPALMSDEKIVMTNWELQDLAVQVIRHHLEKDGYQLMSWQGNPDVDPAIWFIGNSKKPEWVVIRAARYPELKVARPSNWPLIAESCSRLSPTGHFACVSFASDENSFEIDEKEVTPIYRGHGIGVKYDGFSK
jgi:hypothetical protein